MPIFRTHLESYYRDHGLGPDSPSVVSTLRTNGELVPGRARQLLRMARDLGGLPAYVGRMLEAGSGFGALAAYFASRPDVGAVTAVDLREDFLEIARTAAQEANLRNIEFRRADLVTLEGLEDNTFDFVLVNNAFIYLTSEAAENAAMASLARVLRPGGTILIHHANRWRWTEPFTGAPIVHMLPAGLARRVSSRTGWKHNHGRVRLISPPSLARAMRRAGLHDVRIGHWSHGATQTGPRAHLANFYAAAARMPDPDSVRSGVPR